MSLLLSIDALVATAFEPTLTSEARFFMSGNAAPLSPVLIDTDTLSQGTDQTLAGTYGQPISYNGALYVTLWSQNVDQIFVLKSLDSGANWVKLDEANSPAVPFVPSHYFDGSSTIYTVYQAGGGNFGPKQFQNFDLASETWGPVYGTNAQPDLYGAFFLYARSNGTILVVTGSKGFGSSVSDSTMLACSYDIGTDTWGVPFDPGTGFTALPNYDGTRSDVPFVSNYMDGSDTVGIFINVFSFHNVPVIWNNRVFFQQINPDDSLGAFFDFPGQTTSPQDLITGLQGPPFGSPQLVGDMIVLPVTRNQPAPNTGNAYPSIYIGTPISNPVWIVDPSLDGIDAAVNGGDESLRPNTAICGTFDGTAITFVWITPNAADDVVLARIRRATTTNLADPTLGWVNDTLFDMTVDPAPPGFYPIPGADQGLFLPSLFFLPSAVVLVDCNNPPTGIVGTAYSHSFTASGGTPPYTFSISVGSLPPGLSMDASGNVTGTPTLAGTFIFTVHVVDSAAVSGDVQCSIVIAPRNTGGIVTGVAPYRICKPKNFFDCCADREAAKLRKIRFPRLCSIPPEWRNCLPWDEEGGAYPPGSTPWNILGSIVTPAPASGNQTIARGRVPIGYDLLLSGFLWNYTGTGFIQGSGDIAWRVKVNLHYLPGFGAVEFQMGSTTYPVPATEGVVIFSGEEISLETQVYNTSGNIQVGTSRIFGGLVGFWWPR